MTSTSRLVEHLVEVWPDVVSNARASVRQLHVWTGGFRSSTVGASTTSSPPPAGQTTSELPMDRARRDLARIFELVDLLVVQLGDLGDALGGERLPSPSHRLEARLAFVQWQINKLADRRVPAARVDVLEVAVREVNELDRIVKNAAPAPGRVRPVDVCHAHDKAGLDATIDSKYRRWQLCRWCGDFRTTHGVHPPVKLVRLHDRGISMSTSLLRAAGIRTTQSRRQA